MSELYKYRHMLLTMILSNMRTRYKGSFFGFLWTLLNPLLLLGVYSLVFSVVMRVDIPYYTVYLFIGLLGWVMFQSAISDSVVTMIANANLIKKIYFPREILPISQVLASVVNYLFSLVVLFLSFFWFGMKIPITILYLPIILLIQIILMIGISLLVSSVQVFFRDLQHILNIFMLVWFYFTPIVYVQSMIPDQYMTYFMLNPMFYIISSYQDIFYNGSAPDLGNLTIAFIYAICLLIIGWKVFARLNRQIAEEL
ncbi:ABC transporter permease [Paenibacillus sp. GYB004]|uniref:ABC transporter permease n=1 Tax=Paenibacillus sp. GYB004 TaxID=2994393 RepID=UPI002F969F2B